MTLLEQRAHTAGRSAAERDLLVEGYLPLIRHVVARLPVSRPTFLDIDDLHGAGVLGLIRAAETWHPNGGASFKTFAYTAIRGAVLDELRHHDPVPRARRARLRDFDEAADALRSTLDRAPSLEEIAAALGLSPAELDEDLELAHRCRTTSLDAHGIDDDLDPAPSRAALLIDEDAIDPCAAAVDVERTERVAIALAELPEQERRVVVLYHLEGLYLKEIGELLGVTESRISQILSRALARLRLTAAAEH